MLRIVFILVCLSLNFTNLNADDKIAFLNVDTLIQNTTFGKSIVKKIENLKIKDSNKFKERERKIRSQEEDLIKKKIFYLKKNLKKT